MRAWLAVAMITMALSGCAEEGTTVPVTESETGTNETTEPTPPVQVEEEVNVTNEPPVADLTADRLNGTAPLKVNFTIDGSDADGDNLTWTVAVNGSQVANGTSVPATFNHTFAAGLWNVTVSVSDGEHVVDADLVIRAVEAVPEPILEEYECTSQIGLPVVSGSVAGNNVGGCPLTGDLTDPRIVHEVSPDEGCTIRYDTDGDGTADGIAEVGQRHEPGTSFTAFCDPGTSDSTNRLVLEVIS